MFTLWRNWLLAVMLGLIVFGITLTLAGTSALFAPLNEAIAAALYGAGGAPPGLAAYERFSLGLIGATTAGWGVMCLVLVWYGFQPGRAWVWTALAVGFTVWFVLDTSLSLWLGVSVNAALNTAMFALVVLPLAATRRVMIGAGVRSTSS